MDARFVGAEQLTLIDEPRRAMMTQAALDTHIEASTRTSVDGRRRELAWTEDDAN